MKKGFTLIEIMVVVSILAVLASIAMLNFIRIRMNAHEGAIKKELRTFSAANESFRATQDPPAYTSAIAILTGASPPYLDPTWNTNPRHGYNLTYAGGGPGPTATTYSLFATAIPTEATTDYCVDQTGVIVSGGSGNATGCSGGTPIP